MAMSKAVRKAVGTKMVADAEAAARRAADGTRPEGMLVYEADGLSNRPKPDARAWYEPEGLCGFSWVNIKPAYSWVAKAIRENATDRDFGARNDSYEGGTTVWIGYGGQSHARKVRAANAYAEVIKGYIERSGENVRVYVGDRLD